MTHEQKLKELEEREWQIVNNIMSNSQIRSKIIEYLSAYFVFWYYVGITMGLLIVYVAILIAWGW